MKIERENVVQLLRLFVVIAAPAAAFAACRSNPDIDGSTVPKIGSAASPPTCEQVCARLEALCGYAPVECVARCASELDEATRVCRGQASSCREALSDCVTVASDVDAGEEDGGEEDGGGGEEDGGTEPTVDASPDDGGRRADGGDAG